MIEINGIYYDDYDLPVHLDGGGDSLQRLGMLHLAFEFRRRIGVGNHGYYMTEADDYRRALKHLEVKRGVYRRHPSFPYNDVDSGKFVPSRDQFVVNIVAMGQYRLIDHIERIVERHEDRFLYSFQNGDLCSPEFRNIFDRSLLRFNDYRLGDLFLFLSTVFLCKYKKSDPDSVDDITHLASLISASLTDPTWLSRKAIRYYLKNRPHNFGNKFKGETDPVMGWIAWYFRKEVGAPYGMVELWRPIINWLRGLYDCPVK